MKDDKEILFPDRELTIGGQKVTVRELFWKDQLDFLGELGAFLRKVQDDKGEVRMDIGIIADLISGSRELVESLLTKATDKDVEFFGKLRSSQVLAVVTEALDLNLAVLRETGKGIAGRLKESGVGRTPTPARLRSEEPTPSS